MNPTSWRLRTGALLILVSGLLALRGGTSALGPAPRAYEIPITGKITPILLKTIDRRVQTALEGEKPEVIFFTIDSYGGRVDAAESIAHLIDTTTGVRKVAFVSNKAISAGAFIAIACDEIVMRPTATLGDIKPIQLTIEGVSPVDEKFESAFRSKLQTYAEDRGYPQALAGAMVSQGYEVLRVPGKEGSSDEFVLRSDVESWSEFELRQRKIVELSDPTEALAGSRRFAVMMPDGTEEPLEVVVREGEICTLDGKKAADYGFAKHLVEDFDEVLALYTLSRADVEILPILWWERFVDILNSTPAKIILVGLGLLLGFIEMKIPGFGLPGILGLLCFALLFFASHLAGLAQWIEILMFFVGVVLIVLEIFVIPGFGVAGISGIVLVLASLVLALVSFSPARMPTSTAAGWAELGDALAVVFGGIGSFFVAMMVMIRFLPKTPIFGRIIQGAELSAADGYTAQVADGAALHGRVGRAITVLRPAGKIEIDGSTYDAAAQGEFIEKGDAVRVVDTSGNRIAVRKA